MYPVFTKKLTFVAVLIRCRNFPSYLFLLFPLFALVFMKFTTFTALVQPTNTLLIALLLLATATAFAQPATTETKSDASTLSRASKMMEDQVNGYVEALNNVATIGTTDRVMANFAPNYKGDMVIYDLDNKMQFQNRDFYGMQQAYNRILQPGNSVSYRVLRFLKSYANDTIGYAVYEVEYDLLHNGTAYRTGEQTVTFESAKRGDKWQFVRGLSFVHYKAVEKGICSCMLFDKGTDYIAQIETPQGEDYSTKFHSFKFKPAGNGQQEVIVDGSTYIMTKEGRSYITTPDRRTLELRTGKDLEAVNVILSDLHRDHCFSVNFK